jgi:hypothetical protein
VESPGEGVDLSATDWADGSTASAFLADAGSLDEMEDSPIDDAEVAMELDGEPVDMISDSPGSFSVTSAEGLGWNEGTVATLIVERDGDHFLALVTPAAPDSELPETWARGEALPIEVTGDDYDNAVVTAIRLEDGETVYDSLPTDIVELYRFTHSAGSLSVEVPGSALTEPGPYLIGVTGLVNADPDTYEEVNLALSAMTAGAMRFYPVMVE